MLLALLCGLGLVLPAPPRVVAAPSNDWPSPPAEQGLDSANLANALLTMPHEVTDLHRGLLLRDGKIVAAAVSPYDDTTPHDLGSVTKSGLTTLIGSAIDQGPLRRDDPVLAVFPDRTIANLDERRARMTVADLARMTSGFGSLQPTR